MGLSSKKQKTSSSETSTATTTPNVPSFLSQPYQTFAGNVAQLNPSGMGAVGPSALQNQAFSMVQGLGSNQGLTDAQNATRGLLNFTPQQVSAAQSAAPGTYTPQAVTAPSAYTPQQVTVPSAYTPQAVSAPSAYTPGTLTAQSISAPGAYTPQQVSATPVTAGQLASTDLSPYFNPYQQNVIDLSLADLERSRAGAISAGQGAATSAGAYGGSRHGVADSLTNEAFGRTAAQTAAELRSRGFLEAQRAAGEDISRRYGADTFNAGQNLQAQGMNQGAGLTAGLADRANQFAASQFNANAGQQAGMFNLSNAQQAALQANADQLEAGMFNSGQAQQAGLANNANLLQAGMFNSGQAQQAGLAANADQMQAGMFNSGQAQQAGLAAIQNALQNNQFNAGQSQQAALANQNAGLQGANFQLGAANQLGALGSAQGADARANAGLMGDLGAQQRAIELENDPWRRQAMALAMQGGLLGAIPANVFTGQTMNASGTQNTTTTQTPSMLDSLGRIASIFSSFSGKGG